MKMTFGIQDKQIEYIDKCIEKRPYKKYNNHFWEDIGNKFGWCKLTIALHYFKYKQKECENQKADEKKSVLPISDVVNLACNRCKKSLSYKLTDGECIICNTKL